MKNLLTFLFFTQFTNALLAQSVAINTDGSTANTSSILDIKSTTRGILVPRLSKLEKNGIATPASGLLIYQNAPDSIGFQYYDGAKWIWILGNNNMDTLAWKTNGNANTTTKFIGTTDNQPLRFRINNKWAGQIDSTSRNISFGLNAGAAAGIGNISVGSAALKTTFIGSNNIAIGDSALPSNNIGSRNVGIGSNALYKINNTNSAIGIGTATLGNNTNPAGSVAIGDSAGYNTTGSESVHIGFKASRSFSASNGYRAVVVGAYAGDSSVANNSTVIGSLAGRVNTRIGNTFIGTAAGEKTTTATVTAIGDNAARNTVSGRVTAIGTNAANDNITGKIVAVGAYAGSSNIAGNLNTFVGDYSGVLNSYGGGNTFIGEHAGSQNTFGSNNTFLGTSVGHNNTYGSYNTLLGVLADIDPRYAPPFLTNATAIGAFAKVEASNAMVLGSINGVNGAIASTNVGIGTTTPLTTLDVRGGIKTMYSGSIIIICSAGLNIYNLPISPAVPADWDFTNTMVIVSVVDGTTGTIYQTKLINTSQIRVDMNNNFAGGTRFNYIIFKL